MARKVFAQTPYGEVIRTTQQPYTFVAIVVADGLIKHATYTKGTEADARSNARYWERPGNTIHVYPVQEKP